MNKPAITVNICTWRPNETFFREAVSSILRQTMDDFELVIVEDPSPVDGKNILGDLLADPRIRYQQNEARTGLLAQKNTALALSTAPLIAILDHDDVAEPQRLERQYAFLSSNEQIHAVGSWIIAINEAGEEIGLRRYPTGAAAVRRALRRISPIAHPSVMFRRDTVLRLKGYTWSSSDDPHGLVSDYDLWCRMGLAGYQMDNIPEPLLRYRIHSLAQKREATKRFLRATIAIKRRYLLSEFALGDWLRYCAEHVLLCLPSSLIWRLFVMLTYRGSGNGRMFSSCAR